MSRRYSPVQVEYVRLDLVCPDDKCHTLGVALRQDGVDGVWPKRGGLHVTYNEAGRPQKVEGRCQTCRSRRRPQLTWVRIVAMLDELQRTGSRHARLPLDH